MEWRLYPSNEFTRWAQTWDLLNTQNGGSLLLSSEFIQPLIDVFGTNTVLAICHKSKAVIAMAIISEEHYNGWSTFQPSQAPIGLWLQEREHSTEQLAGSLLSRLPGINWVFSITQQDPELLARPKDSDNFNGMDYIDTARLSTTGNFDDYFQQRSKNHRQNLRRQRNRLQREGITPRLEIINDEQQVARCIREYGNLESAGWKKHTDTAIHPDNDQGRFYQQLLQTMMAKQQALVFAYYYQQDEKDQLVAMDLAIHNGQSIILLKTTYDESINTSSPAVLMHQEIFQHLFEHTEIQQVEFYGKVMDWHRKWSDDVRTLYHITYYSWPAHMAKKAIRLAQPVRNLLKL